MGDDTRPGFREEDYLWAATPVDPRRTEPGQPARAPKLDRVGEYTVIEEIGRGGFGTVYLAEDPKLERKLFAHDSDPLEEVTFLLLIDQRHQRISDFELEGLDSKEVLQRSRWLRQRFRMLTDFHGFSCLFDTLPATDSVGDCRRQARK